MSEDLNELLKRVDASKRNNPRLFEDAYIAIHGDTAAAIGWGPAGHKRGDGAREDARQFKTWLDYDAFLDAAMSLANPKDWRRFVTDADDARGALACFESVHDDKDIRTRGATWALAALSAAIAAHAHNAPSPTNRK